MRPSAVRVRIRSRSTSASPPSTAIISRPVLVAVKLLKLAPLGLRAAGPFTIYLIATLRLELVELGGEGLPDGADAGVAVIHGSMSGPPMAGVGPG
jgi:hypothetical protein